MGLCFRALSSLVLACVLATGCAAAGRTDAESTDRGSVPRPQSTAPRGTTAPSIREASPPAETDPKTRPARACDPGPAEVESLPPAQVQLETRLSANGLDVQGQRARFVGYLELGMYAQARKRLHVGLYQLAQAEMLPPVSTWLELLDRYYPIETCAAAGVRLLSTVDDFYGASPDVDEHMVNYLEADGRRALAIEMLERCVRKYPDDPRWQSRLNAIHASSEHQESAGESGGVESDHPPGNLPPAP